MLLIGPPSDTIDDGRTMIPPIVESDNAMAKEKPLAACLHFFFFFQADLVQEKRRGMTNIFSFLLLLSSSLDKVHVQ